MLAALAICTGLAPDARADNYYADPRPAPDGNVDSSRQAGGHDEYAWHGPRVIVRDNSTNTDYYYCLGADVPTDWAMVADDAESAKRSFTSVSDAAVVNDAHLDSYFYVMTTNWSSHDINVRLITSCTNDYSGRYFPYDVGPVWKWIDGWVDWLLSKGPDGIFEYLIDKALGWDDGSASSATATAARGGATQPAASVAARRSGNRFKLRNGTNRISLDFKQTRRSRRPPAIYLDTQPAAADCSARRMHVNVLDGSGALVLHLDCRGVRRGAFARLKIGKSIRRNFDLDKGGGTVRLHLDKPPGNVEPLVYINARPAKSPCRVRDRDLRLARTTLDLRIDAHCGRVARKAIGRIYVGGLLSPDR